ncbi:MAG: YeiH family putative sulfate export transporter [Variovorax paradoxus]|nr:MAG: YeiH family putative sulfate export transporter [Variovorax paradoxus]PZQ09296.1 MAG: YeiH family putative sulfate export transporter [Variovorax paradoxus]
MSTPFPLPARPSLAAPLPAAARRLAPGLLLVLAIAAAAVSAGAQPALARHGLSALTLAVLAGIVLGNSVYPRLAPTADPGVAWAKHWLLRAGIVLYGLRLSLHDIAQLGVAGVAVDAAVIVSTFGLACWAGQRWLGLPYAQAALIGAGSAICGAAAVLATAPVLRARGESATVAVASVVVFGTLSMLLLPLFATPLASWLGGMPQLGLYIGSTVHEVAQVVAAADAIDPALADAAVVAKMVRVMLLAPFLLALSLWVARSAKAAGAARGPITIPWFALGFLAVVVLGSLLPVPEPLRAALLWLDTVLLATAMAALGLGTHWRLVQRAGLRPLLLAALLFGWLVVGGGLLNKLAGALGEG